MLSTLFAMILMLLFGALILHIAVKIAAADQVKDAGFGRAVITNLTLLVVGYLLNLIPFLGVLLGLMASFVVVMRAYQIGFLRTLLVWIVYMFIMGGLAFLVLAPLGMFAALVM